jgi:hypothetical protein
VCIYIYIYIVCIYIYIYIINSGGFQMGSLIRTVFQKMLFSV